MEKYKITVKRKEFEIRCEYRPVNRWVLYFRGEEVFTTATKAEAEKTITSLVQNGIDCVKFS